MSLLAELGAQGLIAAVGAGGKKSLLQALAREAPPRSALTATVRMAPVPRALAGRRLLGDLEQLRREVPQHAGETLLIYAQPGDTPGRWAGLPPETVAALHAEGGFALTLVKADGARMRGVKAPAPDEPRLPPGTRWVLPVLSLQVLGRPLDAETAHRPERLAAVCGLREGEPLQPAHLSAWMAHPQGALQGVGSAEVVPVINQVDDAADLEQARAIAAAALRASPRFDRVLLSCLKTRPPRWQWLRRAEAVLASK
jgi:probable selenium-dependent hydroxylase accessory protein YqeC